VQGEVGGDPDDAGEQGALPGPPRVPAAGAGTAAAGAGGLVVDQVGEQGGQRAGMGMAAGLAQISEGAPDPVDQYAHRERPLGEQGKRPGRQRRPVLPRGDRGGGHHSPPGGVVEHTHRVRSQDDQPIVGLLIDIVIPPLPGSVVCR
jgi:hypothetical protein